MMTRYDTKEVDSRDVSEYMERIETLKRRITELDQDLRELLSLNDTLKKARLLQNSRIKKNGRRVLKGLTLVR
jgi:predicted  nucleic acid-binding Zn-ribbon protein